MADIPLRTYVQQLDNLIERKQVDEVIAHCRHILGLYPKHLDTYRMLGKALLEKGRHGDAADIFQRVLSVMPDDFISHVGMSIVREDEANLDAAIWHMERAFEAAPANGAIQQELCRLFGRRDGVAPTKARLTRGALARMYAQGGLYLQAEAELKAALAAEADRIDLQTKLAEVYWQTDQPAQAAQTSVAILQKLPYSLEANRILVNVFRAQGRANDALLYRQRLEAIDPYEAFTDPQANGASAAQVDPAKVMVARLEYVPGMEDSGSPDWLASIGAKFEDPAAARAAADAQPEWLSGTGENAQSAADYQPGRGGVPDWLKDLDSGPAAASNAQLSEPPDWLKEISSAPPQPAAVPAGSNENLPDWLMSATGPLPADAVPDWMLKATTEADSFAAEIGTAPLPGGGLPGTPAAAAPSHPNDATLAEAPSTKPLPPLEPAGEVPDWLKATAADQADEELPDWLKAITAQPLPEAQTPPPADAPTVPIPAGQAPDWMQGAAPPVAPAAPAETVPSWLQNAANAPTDTGPLPDWLKVATGELDPAKMAHLLPPEPEAVETTTVAAAVAAAANASPATPDVPAAPAVEMTTNQMAEAEAPTSLSDLPGWLTDLSTSGTTVPATPDVPAAPAVEMTTNQMAEAEAPTSLSDLPDWLTDVSASGTTVPATPDVPAAPAVEMTTNQMAEAEAPTSLSDLPDWLTNLSTSGAPALEPQAAAALPLPEAPVVMAVPVSEPVEPGVEMPDWLKNVAPVDEATTTAESDMSSAELPDWLQSAAAVPAQRSETPVWLQTGPAAPSLVESPADQEPELQIPDWLKDLSANTPPDAAPAQPLDTVGLTGGIEAPAAPRAPVELPDYLQMASPAAIARAEQPLEMEPEEAAPEEEEPAAALPAEIPEWLKALAPVSPDPVLSSDAAPALAAAEAPAGAGLEDSLSWMDELTALAGPVGAADEPATKEPPAWVAGPEPQATSETAVPESANIVAGGLADDTLTAEIPPWAQNVEPGPTDTIASWLAGKHVPDWLRQPANDAPGLPAVEWEPNVAEAAAPAAPADSLESETAAPELSAASEPPAPAEASQAETLDLESMDPEAAFRWLEGLAAQQGANRDELFTVPAEPAVGTEVAPEPPPMVAQEPLQPIRMPAETMAEPAAASDVTSPPSDLEEFLKATEAALPVEPLLDTAPSKNKLTAAAEFVPEPVAPELDTEAALRWLEGLAAQQGAKPEELITAPEDRTLEAPQWVAAEQAAAVQASELMPEVTASVESAPVEAMAVETPEPMPAVSATVEAAPIEAAVVEAAPVEAAAVEAPTEVAALIEPVSTLQAPEMAAVESPSGPAAAPSEMDAPTAPESIASDADAEAEAAMRWLEGLAAQQGAKPEELLTAPEERTLETPAWISAHAANAATEPVAEASPFESVAPAVKPAPEPVAIVEPVAVPEPTPEPATVPETPKWIAGVVTADDQLSAAPVPPAGPASATEPAASAEPTAPAVPETPEWLAAAVTAEDQLAAAPATPAEPAGTTTEPPASAEAAPPPATGVAADLDKLSRLAERLGAARRAREAEMEARFAEQRNQQEAARRLVEERLQTKRAEPGSAAAPEPAARRPRVTGPLVGAVALTTPVAPPEPAATPAIPAPVAEVAPLAVAALAKPVAAPQPVAPVTSAPEVSTPLPTPVALPQATPAAAADALAAGQAALAGQDYSAAVTHFSALVEQGHHLDTVVQSLAVAAEGGQAPSPLLRLLGDAYVRTDQLQKALDTYRQALRRL